MNIFTTAYTPPQGFETEACSCFFTDPGFYQSDFDAVIASRDNLRIWSDSGWPEDNFTAEINREDLQLHVDDNEAHEAYGYMLYDPTRTRCYGSLYVNPTTRMAENYEFTNGTEAVLQHFDARIDYWLSSDIRDMHLQLSRSICHWIRDSWAIRAGFTVRERAHDRIKLYDAIGLQRSLSLRYRETGTALYLYS